MLRMRGHGHMAPQYPPTRYLGKGKRKGKAGKNKARANDKAIRNVKTALKVIMTIPNVHMAHGKEKEVTRLGHNDGIL